MAAKQTAKGKHGWALQYPDGSWEQNGVFPYGSSLLATHVYNRRPKRPVYGKYVRVKIVKVE